jgi:glycerophosphoryl diester phosphodiesterase
MHRIMGRGIVACVLPLVVGGSLLEEESLKPNQRRDRNEVPIVIAHRGASGHRPEHTLAAYTLAIESGADFVEPDLVSTKDGVLVARHENEISGTTDVAAHPEFTARRTTKTIDGAAVTGWFTEDFSLAELETLYARERLPEIRGTGYDGRFRVPTFQQIIALVAEMNARLGREGTHRIGIYPETKHPTYFAGIGLPLEEPLVAALDANGYRGTRARVFIQSFEVGNLKKLATLTQVPLIQLIDAAGKPYDFVVSSDPRSYADLITRPGLTEIASYADGIGVNKALILPRDAQNRLLPPTRLIRDAHRAGLAVHGWTLRGENAFLPAELQLGSDPRDIGDMLGEARLFLKAGIDGYFTDHPGIGVAARDAFVGLER